MKWSDWLSIFELEVGGPVDIQYPQERLVLAELAGGPAPAVFVATLHGARHRGGGPAFTTQSEVGIALEWSRAGDRFDLYFWIEVAGVEFRGPGVVDGRVPLGVWMRHRSRSAAISKAPTAETQCSWAGDRLAIRKRFPGDDWGQDFRLIDLAVPERPRWGSIFSDQDCRCVAASSSDIFWNE